MKWNANHIICKPSVISYTSVLAAAILISIGQINLSRRVHHDQSISNSLKFSGAQINTSSVGANNGRKNVMFCGADGTSVGCSLVRGDGYGPSINLCYGLSSMVF
jgi:hypothetical protein